MWPAQTVASTSERSPCWRPHTDANAHSCGLDLASLDGLPGLVAADCSISWQGGCACGKLTSSSAAKAARLQLVAKNSAASRVTAYPLAMWFAASWWRLNYEPLPAQQPGHDWRMVHELGAANHGFVWPRVIFVPDGESIHLWAAASLTPDQSVQYLRIIAFSLVTDSNGTLPTIDGVETIALLMVSGHPGWGRGTGGGTKRSLPPNFPMRSTA